MTMQDALPVATRAWMVRDDQSDDRKSKMQSGQKQVTKWRKSVLIFDTETTTDPTQRLTFGCYRFGEWNPDGSLAIREEGLFHDDDLPEHDPDGYAMLRNFAMMHDPETTGFHINRTLMLRSRRDFLDSVLWPAIQADALIVGFNLPFDLSRLASDVTPARGKYKGGFSFVLWQYTNAKTGKIGEHQFRPRITVKHDDNKRSRIGITQPNGRPKDSDGKPIIYRPGFLDLRTLAFALTDRGHSLRSACVAFDVEQGKFDPGTHGRITREYVDYAWQDVAATAALLEALRIEFDRHPIDLEPCRAYSPATIAKRYFASMGITPRLDMQPDFPPEILGYAMSAYFGGRSECAIRRTPVPVVYTDVLSMYPTVNANMELWRFHTAERIELEACTDDAKMFLNGITPEKIRDPETWRELTFFAQIIPDGDIVPVRAQYGDTGGTWNIGVNPFYDDQPHWYAGPDLAAAVLLSGKIPTILKAFRLVPLGRQSGLQPVSLRNAVEVNPASDDFFRAVIEERKRVPKTDPLNRFLKVLASSGSYGVAVESNPERLNAEETATISVYGPDDSPFTATAIRPETPGTFSFPPIAALITAGAKLILTLIERMVTDAGGNYAFCDTDSMAIVAMKDGGLIPCAGGAYRLSDGLEAVKALSWKTVDDIAAKLASLNPYDPDIVSGSILEIENVNFDPESGERRQLWCVSIAAKRYALYTLNPNGEPAVIPDGHTRHGLGYLIDPRDAPETDDDPQAGNPSRERWESALWTGIVRNRLGLDHQSPPWHDRPAVSRLTISSPWHLAAFDNLNAGKSYADQIKPFNFMLAAHQYNLVQSTDSGEHASLRLVTAYESNPKRWTLRNWFDIHSGAKHRITVKLQDASDAISVRDLATIASQYPHHPEPKRIGPDDMPCHKQTEGVLSRRPVQAAGQVCIGKEAHRLEERELFSDLDELQSTYADPRRESWTTVVLPKLRVLTNELSGMERLMEVSGRQSSAVYDMLNGTSRPRKDVRIGLTKLVNDMPDDSRRECAGCGAPFAASDPRQKYCSMRCRERMKKRRSRHWQPLAELATDPDA